MAKQITPGAGSSSGRVYASGAAPSERMEAETTIDGSAPVLPNITPTPPFLYAWHPKRWTVCMGELVPSLRKVQLQPGVNKVQRRRDGKYFLGDLRTVLEAKGWTLIPYNKGPGGRTYMHRFETSQGPEGARAHMSIWESAYPGSEEIGSDTEGYVAWLRSLVEAGVIPPCPAHIADRLADRSRATLAAYEEKISRGGVSYESAARQLRTDIAVLDDHLDELKRTARPADAEGVDLDFADGPEEGP